jgi:gluconolactonase
MSNRLDEFELLVDGLDHAEGLYLGPDGMVYGGGEEGQIYRIDVERGTFEELASTGGSILGIALDGENNAYACDYVRGEVCKVDLASGEISTYSAGTAEAPSEFPNGLGFAADGTLYWTDSATPGSGKSGRVYAVSPQGETTVWSTDPGLFTNGLCIDPAGEWLYFAESTLPGISRQRIETDGSAGEYEVLVETPGAFPDGVALTDDGTIVIGCYQPDTIYSFRIGSQLEILADDPGRLLLNSPASTAFAGADRQILVASSFGRRHAVKAELGIRGCELHYPTFAD